MIITARIMQDLSLGSKVIKVQLTIAYKRRHGFLMKKQQGRPPTSGWVGKIKMLLHHILYNDQSKNNVNRAPGTEFGHNMLLTMHGQNYEWKPREIPTETKRLKRDRMCRNKAWKPLKTCREPEKRQSIEEDDQLEQTSGVIRSIDPFSCREML